MAALAEPRIRGCLLEIASADLCTGNLCRDRQHRHAGTMAIEQAVYQMQVARSAASGAYGEIAGEMRLGSRGERRCLFMPRMDPGDVTALAQCLGHAVQ